MRVTAVVTLVSDDGAYGGPVSVATGQLAELAARGHEVGLLSLWRGRGAAPAEVDGVPLRSRRARTLIPGQGFLGLLHPLLLLDLWREAGRADALHLHAGRDLVSLAALTVAAARRRRFVVQTHGMVQPRDGAVARVFDTVYVPLLRRAAACLYLTEEERAGLEQVLGPRRPPLLPLPNGVRPQPEAATPDPTLVLYLARLHPRKRPQAFVEMAALLAKEFPQSRFLLHGADEGELPAVHALIREHGLEDRVTYGGALDHPAALRAIAGAGVYVLPSVDEPFPMSVLEALAAGTPVVCTESCGIAEELRHRKAALVTDGSPGSLADAVRTVLTDEATRRALVEACHRAVKEAFSVTAVADRLEELYR